MAPCSLLVWGWGAGYSPRGLGPRESLGFLSPSLSPPAQVLTPATAGHWVEDGHFGPGWRADSIPVISVTSGNRCRRTGRLVSRMFGKLEVQRGRANSFSAGLLWEFIPLMCRVRDSGSVSNISHSRGNLFWHSISLKTRFGNHCVTVLWQKWSFFPF